MDKITKRSLKGHFQKALQGGEDALLQHLNEISADDYTWLQTMSAKEIFECQSSLLDDFDQVQPLLQNVKREEFSALAGAVLEEARAKKKKEKEAIYTNPPNWVEYCAKGASKNTFILVDGEELHHMYQALKHAEECHPQSPFLKKADAFYHDLSAFGLEVKDEKIRVHHETMKMIATQIAVVERNYPDDEAIAAVQNSLAKLGLDQKPVKVSLGQA